METMLLSTEMCIRDSSHLAGEVGAGPQHHKRIVGDRDGAGQGRLKRHIRPRAHQIDNTHVINLFGRFDIGEEIGIKRDRP